MLHKGVKGFLTKKMLALLLSFLPVILAVTAEQKPLIFPLYSSPEAFKMKAWVFTNNDIKTIKQTTAKLDPYFQNDIYTDEAPRQPPKTLVFGSIAYRNPTQTRPSSAVQLNPREGAVMFASNERPMFCVGAINHDSHLARILRRFDKKMVSFWWDSTTELYRYHGTSHPIAELAIGGVNPSRFVPSTEMRVKLAPVDDGDDAVIEWKPVTGTIIRVGSSLQNWDKDTTFDIGLRSFIPTDIYDAITKPLRDEIAYTVGLMKGMPQDTNMRIMQYMGGSEPVTVFDCKDAPKLLPLHIGQLTIPPSMMFKRTSDGKCKMTLIREGYGNEMMQIGVDLIRQFYFSIVYDSEDGSYVQFATRVEGDPPELQESMSRLSLGNPRR